ncbi:MAG: RnfABCDGE type electron transport complex subunit G [Lachnospiraceae bacterium]|nr:RnfABCDGE type electron transport complex subunit G [Lachnospiraceae bacterium]
MKKNTIAHDALILFLITIIAGFALGLVHEITLEPIEAAEEAALQEAYQDVFPDATEFTELPGFSVEAADSVMLESGYQDEVIEDCVQAIGSDGSLLGYVINATDPSSYGGNLTLSLGVQVDGTVNGYSITDISDTPGLGMKATEDDFSSQFVNKKIAFFTVTKTGSTSEDEIDAISGATITSNAVTRAVNAGLCYFRYVVSLTGGEVLE